MSLGKPKKGYRNVPKTNRNRHPLRKIVGHEYGEGPSRFTIYEVLECGHKQLSRRDIIGETNAVRRRCLRCTIEAEANKENDTIKTITSSCPTWDNFILQAMGGDPGSVNEIRAALKGSLTGSAYKKIVVLVGPPASGKSTFMNAVGVAMGDLATWVDERVLFRPSLSEFAEIEGKRFLFVEGDLAKILTPKTVGLVFGNKIGTKKLGEKYREFTPEYRIFLASQDFDEDRVAMSINRQIQVFRFHKTTGELDTELLGKLSAEADAISEWIGG